MAEPLQIMPAAVGEGFDAFASAARAIVPVFQAIATAFSSMAPLVEMMAGFEAGRRGDPRDWKMPDDWHRGYLRGRLLGIKERHGR
jgi:hypothetical protein